MKMISKNYKTVFMAALFSIAVFVSAVFSANAAAQTAGAANEAAGTIVAITQDDKTADNAGKAGEGKESEENAEAVGEEGDNAYLSEAGKFNVENFDATVWVLVFLALIALAVSIERLWYLNRNRGKNAELVNTLISGLSNDPAGYRELISRFKEKKFGIEGRVASKTLEGWSFGRDTMIEFSKAAIGAETRSLEKRLVVLSTLGNNTPFIGLLGTVLGIMKAFRDLALVGDAGPAVVMKGISEALIATACGLAVAIPCVIAFNAFSKSVKNRLSNAQEIIDILLGIRAAYELKSGEGLKEFVGGTEFMSGKKDNGNSKKPVLQAQAVPGEGA